MTRKTDQQDAGKELLRYNTQAMKAVLPLEKALANVSVLPYQTKVYRN
jgi:hypothetical protein